MKKYFLIAILVLFLSGCGGQKTITVNVASGSQPVFPTSTVAEKSVSTGTASSSVMAVKKQPSVPTSTDFFKATATAATTTIKTVNIPAVWGLKVAFASQAPLLNWDALHEEACEEASMIMAYYYFKSEALDKNIMEDEIQKLVKWETDNGYSVDLTAEEMVKIIKQYFHLSASVSRDVTIDQIKYQLSQNHLVIIPAAGRDLGNPNYKAPGPVYHVLLIRGYNEKDFITNDPGTRKGNGYRYSYQTLLNAVHDWNPLLGQDGMTDAEMRLGDKVMVTVW